jgi:hypothetical protein
MTMPSGTAGASPDGDGATGGSGGRGGPPLWFAVLGIGGLVLAVILIAAQALGIGTGGSTAPATIPPAGAAAARTRDLVARALGDASFQVTDPQTPYRPGESPGLIDVPRLILQAVLPSDPTGGYIVIYELSSNNEADRAGRDFAAYLAGGTGAIQYPRDAQFVLRRVGQTIVFFPWSPSVSPDPEVARLAGVLATVGEPLTP